MVPEQVDCTPFNAKAGRQQAVTGTSLCAHLSLPKIRHLLSEIEPNITRRQLGPNPSLWQLLKDTAGLLLLLGATVLLARVVAVLGRTVDGQRETLAQHRRLSLPPPPPPPADGVRGSKGPGPGAGAALSKKLLREAAPWCVSRTPSYDDSVGTSDEAEPLTREEKQSLQPFCPRPPVGLPCSPSWDLDDADSIAVSESASQ
eukprot:EG_transcript_31443